MWFNLSTVSNKIKQCMWNKRFWRKKEEEVGHRLRFWKNLFRKQMLFSYFHLQNWGSKKLTEASQYVSVLIKVFLREEIITEVKWLRRRSCRQGGTRKEELRSPTASTHSLPVSQTFLRVENYRFHGTAPVNWHHAKRIIMVAGCISMMTFS